MNEVKREIGTRDLANIMYANSGILIKDAEVAIKEVMNAICTAFEKYNANSVCFKGYFKITKRHKNKRNGRNPKTGEIFEVPEHSVLYYRTGSILKDAVTGSN